MPTHASLAVAQESVTGGDTVAQLVGLVNVGSVGFVVSRLPISPVDKDSLPVWRKTYIFLAPSLPAAGTLMVNAVHPVKMPDVVDPVTISPVIV